MLGVLIIVGGAFLLQGLMSFLQMRHLTNEFLKLRRKGKVAFGRKSGGFRAGAVVMFGIDDDGIKNALLYYGVTLILMYLSTSSVPLAAMIEDAALTYRKYTAGELVEDTRPQGPIDQALAQVKGLLGRAGKKVIAR